MRISSVRFLLAFVLAAPLAAQQSYQQPPTPIAQILDADPLPSVSVSPDRRLLLLLERPALPSIAEVAAPEIGLAGSRIDPRLNGPARTSPFTGVSLLAVDAPATAARRVVLPAGTRVSGTLWSTDGRQLALTLVNDSSITLAFVDPAAATPRARVIDGVRLNAAGGTPCRWMDAARLACLTIPRGRGAAPPRATVPTGPIVQEASGRAAANRTYQDLLQSPDDERQFEYYFTSQVAIVSVAGATHPVGSPAIITGLDPSPDGRFLLVETTRRPFSYVVPMSRFPARTEVWDTTGAVVRQIADGPLLESVPIAFDAVAPGPRAINWRADAPATLLWAEALDDGDPAKAVPKRDRVRMLAAPFSGDPATLIDLEYRVREFEWARPDLAFVTEGWTRTRRTRTWAIDPSRPASAPRVFSERSSEDRYADPGRFATVRNAFGRSVLLLTPDGRSAYRTGAGASPEGDRPFLDRVDLATGRAARLWRSAAPYYEDVVAVLDPAARRIITRRESATEPPNYFVRDVARGRLTALTRFTDPAPQFAGVTTRLITYKRADGVDLSAKLYLPPGYDPRRDGPLPFLFWAYPREFRSAAAAAQVSGSPHRFVRPTGSSHLFLLTQGYGILDDPTMPIIGEGDREPNDTYVEQLVASAQAAADEIVRLGVGDRARIGVGGHSYGAFMTANLLAHSRIFRAGIARSGAYNRTLTPFGFQAEERPYWQARDIYERMSPFTYADSVKAPILLIHGMADDNSGTFPVQSERFFAALKGHGATVRYVQLPAEAHGYRARESVGHTLWEMVRWMDLYVKPAQPTALRP